MRADKSDDSRHVGRQLKGDPLKASCQDCRFFGATGGQAQGNGQCRRYPPTIPNSPKADSIDLTLRTGVWPMVASGSWCGEFKAQQAADKN